MDTFNKLGVWDVLYKKRRISHLDKKVRGMYGDTTTAKLAAEYLAMPEIKSIEDWGCGFGGFEHYIASWQTYIGVDGSKTIAATKISDLSEYKSEADAVHLRHVLEHNQLWDKILKNLLASFKKRAVITIFTPFSNKTQTLNTYKNWKNSGFDMVDISFCWEDLKKIIDTYPDVKYQTQFDIRTRSSYDIEHVIYLYRT